MERNCLLNITKQTDDNPDEINLFQNFPYVSHDQFLSVTLETASDFTVLSLNCQSLNAKYNNLQCFLQVCTTITPTLTSALYGYRELGLVTLMLLPPSNWIIIPAFPRAKNVQPMEALLSIKQYDYQIKDICPKSDIWEGLFIDVTESNDKKLTLGNVYKPPKTTVMPILLLLSRKYLLFYKL